MLLYNEKSINLGACGTHILEHYFGSIRRHSAGDNTHDRFTKSMKKVFLEQHLLNELEIPYETPRRRNNSGFNVNDSQIKEKNTLMYYLEIARGILLEVMNIPDIASIFMFAMPEKPMTIIEFSEIYLEIKKKKHEFRSTKITGITSTGGLSNCRIWSAANQIANLSKQEN